MPIEPDKVEDLFRRLVEEGRLCDAALVKRMMLRIEKLKDELEDMKRKYVYLDTD